MSERVSEWDAEHARFTPSFPSAESLTPQLVASDPKSRILKRLSIYDKPVDPPVRSLMKSPLMDLEDAMYSSEEGLRACMAGPMNEIRDYVE